MTKPITLVVVSDLHAGSTLGLCPPRFELDDGGDYVSSRPQRWLWRNWLDFNKRVKDVALANGGKLVAVINGDIIEGNHHRTLAMVTSNETTMMRLAYKVMRPLVEMVDDVYITRGTPAHVGQSARLEERIADDITNVVRPGEHRATWDQLLLNANGTIFDIAHHGSLGRLPWTRANAINRIAGQVIISYAESGDKPPNVVVRSHLHQYADTYNNYSKIRVIASPGWQLITGYVNRIQPGAIADIGGLIFSCQPRGIYDLEVVRFRPKRTAVIKV